jgi:hypothetical protein
MLDSLENFMSTKKALIVVAYGWCVLSLVPVFIMPKESAFIVGMGCIAVGSLCLLIESCMD